MLQTVVNETSEFYGAGDKVFGFKPADRNDTAAGAAEIDAFHYSGRVPSQVYSYKEVEESYTNPYIVNLMGAVVVSLAAMLPFALMFTMG